MLGCFGFDFLKLTDRNNRIYEIDYPAGIIGFEIKKSFNRLKINKKVKISISKNVDTSEKLNQDESSISETFNDFILLNNNSKKKKKTVLKRLERINLNFYKKLIDNSNILF